jgi:hypothetical protein
MRFYFHLADGATSLDREGIELKTLNEAKKEALRTSMELLPGCEEPHIWSGEPWKLWVTDQPNGLGITLLSLTFQAAVAATAREQDAA